MREFDGDAADDVEVARAAGLEVRIVPGHEDNLKITHAEDFARAERQFWAGQMDIRIGQRVRRASVRTGRSGLAVRGGVPHDRGLQGHSDADVGMHAVTDAIYGALAEGDIGRHFPPSDPQWKGAESHIFLAPCGRHWPSDKGYRDRQCRLHPDLRTPEDRPACRSHAGAALAGIMGLAPERVSVKATTSERLGFTGREEGIAALATATLVRR